MRVYYLRKISRGKWPSEETVSQASLKDVHADTVIAEFNNIDDNKLSVWKIENDEDLLDAFIALGSNCDNIGTIFAVKIPEEYLNDVTFDEQEGETPTFGINSKHRNITDLNYESLGTVIMAIIRSLREENTFVKMTKPKMKKLLKEAYDMDRLDISRLKDGLKNQLQG